MLSSVLKRQRYIAISALRNSLCSNKICLKSSGMTTSSLMPRIRHFSDDSHPDFAPQSKINGEQNEIQEFLKDAVNSHEILLFMKGSPEAPQCGFSARTVQILNNEGVDFSSANVLHSNEIREGVKVFSDWPTIPQLYVEGEFIGGCDVVTEMHESGELKELLKPTLEKQQEQRKNKD